MPNDDDDDDVWVCVAVEFMTFWWEARRSVRMTTRAALVNLL